MLPEAVEKELDFMLVSVYPTLPNTQIQQQDLQGRQSNINSQGYYNSLGSKPVLIQELH